MARRTQADNDARRLRDKLIFELTGDKKLGHKARDWSNKTFNERVEKYKLPEDKNLFLSYEKATIYIKNYKQKLATANIKTYKEYEDSNARFREFYKIATDNGYTPAEANRLKRWNKDKFENFISDGIVLSKESRKRQWSIKSRKWYKLSLKKIKPDDPLIDLAEQINVDNGIDPNAGYGYGVVWAWYLNGGDIKDYIHNVAPDSQFPDIYYGIEQYR